MGVSRPSLLISTNSMIHIPTVISNSYSLSELPECQVPLAMRTDIVDQTLKLACCPEYDIMTPLVSVNMIMSLANSPGAHSSLVRTEVIEDLLLIRSLREKLNDEQPPAKKEDPAAFKTLQ